MDQTLKLEEDTPTQILSNSIAEKITFHVPSQQHYYLVSDEMLINVLEQHKRRNIDLLARVSLFVALVGMLAFSEAKSILGISPAAIHATFFISMLASFGFLVWGIFQAFKNRGNNSTKAILDDIKNRTGQVNRSSG